MKKTLLFVICLLLGNSLHAQRYFFGPRSDYFFSVTEFYRFKTGIEGGMDISGVSKNSFNFNPAYRTGFNGGLIFDVGVRYPVSFAPEILYVQKGYTAITVNGNFTQRVHFIDIPLLAHLAMSKEFSIYAGPQFTILVGRNNTYNTGFVADKETYYEQYSHRVTLGGVVGISFKINDQADIRIRYTQDLQDNYSNSNPYVPGYRNQVFQFGLGYTFL